MVNFICKLVLTQAVRLFGARRMVNARRHTPQLVVSQNPAKILNAQNGE